MKKSNLFILITSIAIIILTVFGVFYAKLQVVKQRKNQEKRLEKVEVSDFNVLVAGENADIQYIQSDTVRIVFRNEGKDKVVPEWYQLNNDTLYINSVNQVFVYSKNLKSIIGNKSGKIHINKLIADSLSVSTNSGDLIFNNTLNIEDLNIQSKNTNIYFQNKSKIKNLKLQSDKTTANINEGSFDYMELNLKNGSAVYIQNVNNRQSLTIHRDSTSHVTM
ncbi:MAG: DUF4097 family beta strand repeat-containing protein [Paludibacteraceae bacterium]